MASSKNETGVSRPTKRARRSQTASGISSDTVFVQQVRRHRVQPLPGMPNAVPKRHRIHAWHPDYLRPLQLMLMGGATDYEIAEALGVHKNSLYDWRGESPELRKMISDYKQGFDDRIERTLAASALGYTHRAEKIFMADGQVHRVEYIEHVKPDTTAAIFWLKNRQPDRWRDVQRHEVEDTTPTAEEPTDARKVAMAMLNVIRQGMMKRGELSPPPPAFAKEFDHVTDEARSESAGQDTSRDVPARAAAASASDRRPEQGQRDAGEGGAGEADDADYRADRSRPAGRRRRAVARYRDEGDDGIDLD